MPTSATRKKPIKQLHHKENMMDAINKLKKQSSKSMESDFTPPYPSSVLRRPYLAGYIKHPPQFPKYNGEKRNAREHIARYIESMSHWLSDNEMVNKNLLMREFKKILTDGAFSWYYNLEKGSIKDWDDIKAQFHKKSFNVQKQVTMVELVRLEQRMNEDLSN